MKRRVCILLTLAMLLAILPVSSLAAYTHTYYGDILMAVNTNTSTQNKPVELEPEAYTPYSAVEAAAAAPEGAYRVDAPLPPAVPIDPPSDSPVRQSVRAAQSYTAGSSTRSFTEYSKVRHDMKCLYVGTNCTVWGCTSDYTAIQISQAQARQIGQEFDAKFPQMHQYFGSSWYDADGDGKIALLCYDIEQSYSPIEQSYNPYTGSYFNYRGSYTAGYFWPLDMTWNNNVNGIYYENPVNNGIDCVSIDTFPGMGSRYGTPLDDIPRCYSTLFHEMQHLLCYSYQVINGPERAFGDLEVYLDEAFSMAAEHLLYGPQDDRVDYFNSSAYQLGSGLTHWDNTLSHYSNSYLFGQYLRVRYEQLHPGQGPQIYRLVQQRRNADNVGKTLDAIATLLQTDPETLLADFWQAVYQRADSGIYGFNGEDWADALNPPVTSLNAYNTRIDSGGVRFYRLNGGYESAGQADLTLRSLAEGPVSGPSAQILRLERISPTLGKVYLTPAHNCILYYDATTQRVTRADQLPKSMHVSAGQENSMLISMEAGTCPTFYYALRDTASGLMPTLQQAVFPMYAGDYNDVRTSDWFYTATRFVTHHGIMNGTGAGQFSPHLLATRGQLVTMLYRLEGEPDVTGLANPFTDLQPIYYYNAVLWAAENGIVKGVTANTFCPDQKITREQTVTMLHRYAAYMRCDMRTGSLRGFADQASVSGYAAEPFRWAVAEGLINGITNSNLTYLQPQSYTTRAQLATMFQRYCQNCIA